MSKEFKNIDDLFRDKFEHFEVDPPEHIWTNVQQGISGNNPKGPGFNLGNGGIAGITVLLIAIGILSMLFINNSFVISEEADLDGILQEDQVVSSLIAENQVELSSEHPPPQDIVSAGTPGTSDDKPEKVPTEKEEKAVEKKEKRQKNNIVNSGNPKRNSTIYLDPTLPESIPEERISNQSLAVFPIAATAVFVPGNGATSTPETIEIEPTIVSEQPITEVAYDASDVVRGNEAVVSATASKKHNKNYGQYDRWGLGVYFTPEMIVYPSDDQLKNHSYSLDLHATYRPGNYFFQSGLGLARNEEQGNALVNYNDYLGSYQDVYNVTFDSTSNGVEPVYHTQTVEVYDTIDHVVITPTKRYYTYLQIPLFVGYGAESKRFGWFVKGGPSVSFLVHEDLGDSDLSDMEVRILNVENELPGRISTNWQFILTAGATYKLGNRVSISLEPMFRYYIKSVYEQDKLNTKHPYSIGLRTGFLINF